MEIGYQIINWIQQYTANTDVYFPIAFSFIILAIVASITYYLRSEPLRLIAIVLLAGFFYWTSIGGTEFEQEYFLNMSTELIGTIIALVIFASAMTSNGWTFPIVATIVVMLVSVLTIHTQDFSNGFSLNLSTELLGAFLTTVLLKRDWLWEKDTGQSGGDDVLLASVSDWFESRMNRRRSFSNRNEKADYVVMIAADNEIDLADKIAWLTRSGVMTVSRGEVLHDLKANRVYQEVGLAIDAYEKQTENVTLSSNEARVRVLAYPDTAYRVHQQISEVVECDTPRHVSTTNKELAHLEFTTHRPRVLFSDYVSAQINLLVREWRDNADECLTEASVHLMDWATKMNFVKGQIDD